MHKSISQKRTIEIHRRADEAKWAGKPLMFVGCYFSEERRKEYLKCNNPIGGWGSFGVALEDWPEVKKKIGRCLVEAREVTYTQTQSGLVVI